MFVSCRCNGSTWQSSYQDTNSSQKVQYRLSPIASGLCDLRTFFPNQKSGERPSRTVPTVFFHARTWFFPGNGQVVDPACGIRPGPQSHRIKTRAKTEAAGNYELFSLPNNATHPPNVAGGWECRKLRTEGIMKNQTAIWNPIRKRNGMWLFYCPLCYLRSWSKEKPLPTEICLACERGYVKVNRDGITPALRRS